MLLLNGNPVDYFKFSGGEIQVKLPDEINMERAILTWKPSDPDHIVHMMLTVNALKHAGIYDIDLEILYLPYARQDRVCAPGEALSLQTICLILESLQLTTIRIWDVHNRSAFDEYLEGDHIIHISAADIYNRYKFIHNLSLFELSLCAPDMGAIDRMIAVNDSLQFNIPTIVLKKTRCPETGLIPEISFHKSSSVPTDNNILIIDDICDGGATFIKAAELLKTECKGELFLYVTHGIFSKGLDELGKHFKHIFCHHVLHDDKFKSNDKLTILREYNAIEPTISD